MNPNLIKNISNGLMYRDFITVGMLLKKLKIKDEKDKTKLIKDNWIYIQEPEVLLGRLQVFNNWSPYLVSDHEKVWIGLEYFCYTTDELWKKSEKEMIEFAKQELIKIGINADILELRNLITVAKLMTISAIKRLKK